MNNLFIGSIITGIIISGNASGMPNLTPQYTPNNSVKNINSYNAEGNEVFLPVTNAPAENVFPIINRRFSVSARELTSSTPQYIPNNLVKNSSTGNRRFSVSTRELKQNRQELQLIPNSTNAQCVMNQFCSVQKSSIQSEINGNTHENINFLPILRNINSINQSVGQGLGYSNIQGNNNANLTPEQYNYLGYRQTSGDVPYSTSSSLSDILQLIEWQTGIIVETQQELSNLKLQNEVVQQKLSDLEIQNEILKRRNQRYENQEKYFVPNIIAQLKNQATLSKTRITLLQNQLASSKNQLTQSQKYVENQARALQEAIHKLKKQQDRIIYLEQQNENNQTEIAKLKKQITELKNQITKEKTRHETEVNDLKDQMQE